MKKISLLISALCLTTFLNAQTKEYKLTTDRTTEISKKYSSLPTVYKISKKEVGTPTKVNVPNELYTEIQNKINSLVKDSINQIESLKSDFEKYDKKIEIVSEIQKYLISTDKEKIKKEHLIKAQNISNGLNLKYIIYPNKDLFMPLHDICNQISYNNRKPTISRDLLYKLSDERNLLKKTSKTKVALENNNNIKKSTLILDEEVEDIKTISGIFIAIDKEYVVLRRDFEGYNSNELIEVEIFNNKNIPFDNKRDLGHKVVIFNKENDQYYLADRFLLGEFALDMSLVNFENKLNKLGYKTESKNTDIIIFVNTTKLILTNDIYQNVNNGNINYINEIANSVNQFQSYVNQAFPLTEKLVNHFSAHKNRTMNSTRMTQWKSDLKNAKIIYNKINSLKGNNIENATNFNQQISIKTLDKYNEFWQVLRGSEEVLGM